jgi:hypothetical protein
MIARMNARHGRTLPADSLTPVPNRSSEDTQRTRPGRKVIPFILQVEVPETTADVSIGNMLMNILRTHTAHLPINGHFTLSVGKLVDTAPGTVISGEVVHKITDMD